MSVSDVESFEHWGISDPSLGSGPFLFGGALPRIDRGRLGPVQPPDAVREALPGIERIAAAADVQGWYWETLPPHSHFHDTRVLPDADRRKNAWTRQDEERFGAAWLTSLDPFVDGFIDAYASTWFDAAREHAARVGGPLADHINSLIDTGVLEVRWTRDYTFGNAFTGGLFGATVRRRTWEFPTMRSCECCGAQHYADLARYYLIRQYGGPGVCAPCRHAAYFGSTSALPVQEIYAALRLLTKIIGYIPAKNFRAKVSTGALQPAERGLAVAALASIPDVQHTLQITGCATWLEALQRAEIVDATGWRQSRGTFCVARDGHPCRSLAERSICDWLARNGVEHSIEPAWPLHSKLNPNGRRRADWRVRDTFIEYAGLSGNSAYDAKMVEKRTLAALEGIPLLVLGPEDLPRLDEALGMLKPPDPPTR